MGLLASDETRVASRRLWRRVLINVGLRVTTLILLIYAMATGEVSGVALGFVLAGAIAIFLMLVQRLKAYRYLLRDHSPEG